MPSVSITGWVGEILGIAFSIFFFTYLFTSNKLRSTALKVTRNFFFHAYTTQYIDIARKTSGFYLSILQRIYRVKTPPPQRLWVIDVFDISILIAVSYFTFLAASFDFLFDTRWEREPEGVVRHVFDWHSAPFKIPLEYFSMYHLIISNTIALLFPLFVAIFSFYNANKLKSIISFLLIILYSNNTGNLCPYEGCYSAFSHSFLNSIYNFAVHGVYHRPAFAGAIMVFLAFLSVRASNRSVTALCAVISALILSDFALFHIFPKQLSFSIFDFFVFLDGTVASTSGTDYSKGIRNAVILSFTLLNAFVDVLSVVVTMAMLYRMSRAKSCAQYFWILCLDCVIAVALFISLPAAMLIGSFIIDPFFGEFGKSFSAAIQSELIRMVRFTGETRVIWLYLMFATALVPSLILVVVLILSLVLISVEPVIRRVVYAGDYLVSPGEEFSILGVKIDRIDRLFLIGSLGLALCIWLVI